MPCFHSPWIEHRNSESPSSGRGCEFQGTFFKPKIPLIPGAGLYLYLSEKQLWKGCKAAIWRLPELSWCALLFLHVNCCGWRSEINSSVKRGEPQWSHIRDLFRMPVTSHELHAAKSQEAECLSCWTASAQSQETRLFGWLYSTPCSMDFDASLSLWKRIFLPPSPAQNSQFLLWSPPPFF